MNLSSLKWLSCLFSGTHHSGIVITIIHPPLACFKLTAKREIIRNTCQKHLRALLHIIRFFIRSIFIPVLSLLFIIIRKRIKSSQPYTQILVRLIPHQYLNILPPWQGFPPEIIPISIHLPVKRELLVIKGCFSITIPVCISMRICITMTHIMVYSTGKREL